MPGSGVLKGVRVVVAGAGLAGLSAAFDLERLGADVSIVEARDRVGGRLWTIRDGFASGQHAEAGADLIESEQSHVRQLAATLGLKTVRILTRGFGYYGPGRDGHPTIQSQSATFRRFKELLDPLVGQYALGEQRWDNAIAAKFGATSVAEWLREVRADDWLVERFRALRGLFLADPDDLSLLAVVDFFAESPSGPERMMRIAGGNDRLATGLARRLETRPVLNAVLRRVGQHDRGVTVTVEVDHALVSREADFLICTLPPTMARQVAFDPPLPDSQRQALEMLPMGAATRMLIQFDRRFWRRPRRPSAFGSPFAIGAVWDGNEEQRGRGRAGILSLLAGGGASGELQSVISRGGVAAVAAGLSWLGPPSRVLASRTITWEHDPWAKGGYAYFPPTFRPADRDALARPAGRVFFAGEHTSIRWQGYMNGAIESGRRAAAEVTASRPAPRLGNMG